MSKSTLLGRYLRKHEESERSFAERVKTAPSVVHRWAAGDRMPETRFAFAIERATHGEVPASYWARRGDRLARRRQALPTVAPE